MQRGLGGSTIRHRLASLFQHRADIANVQEWLGPANIATTRIHDHRRTRPEALASASREGELPNGSWRTPRDIAISQSATA